MSSAIPRPRSGGPPTWAAVLLAAFLALGSSASAAGGEDGEAIDFGREVRPILSNTCYACHGPDDATREGDLRLDRREAAFADRGGYAAVVPGEAEASELWLRVSDELDPMPPPGSGKELGEGERELLRRWIEEGAPWQEHWSFVPPVRPAPPAVSDAAWARNGIDPFVLSRLETEGLAPEPEASRETLIRRLTYDLTGLPPTVAEVEAFLADEREEAYEQLVERLLDSPRFGEHRARYWLDAARYGDTHGFHLDQVRALWPWRDWVIRAFNDDKPFDEFTVEQLAGDLLPDATLDQRIATGFNRCNPTTGEGGLIEEEYLVKYAVDRVATTSTVWLGLTMACAQCHDHKFDPLGQEEFYEFFAYFHNVAESGNDQNALTPPPFVRAPSPEQEAGLAALLARIEGVSEEMDAPQPELDRAQAEWEAEEYERSLARWEVLDPLDARADGGTLLVLLDDRSLVATGPNPARVDYEIDARTAAVGIGALRLEALPEDGRIGRAEHGNIVLSELELEAAPLGPDGAPGEYARVELVDARADYEQKGFPIRSVLDGDLKTGWAIDARREPKLALLTPREPFGFPGGTALRIRLRHQSGYAQHALARLRLSISNAPEAAGSRASAWWSLGPLPAADRAQAFGRVLAPETAPGGALDLDAPLGLEGDAGELSWTERPELTDGRTHALTGEISSTYLYRRVTAPEARRVRWSIGSDDGVRLWLNGELVLDRDVPRPVAPDQDFVEVELREGLNHVLMKVANYGGGYGFYFRVEEEQRGGQSLAVTRLLSRPPGERSDEDRAALRRAWRRRHSPRWKELDEQLAALRAEEAELDAAVPRTMVMQERKERRPTYFLQRGQYDQKGPEVEPGVPAVLPPLPADASPDRLALARWLVAPEHPLTARVTVNRFWQELFGRGLVATPEDFGAQGEWPSHPQLLDWLATGFVADGWSVKGLLRRIVSSATYRQASTVSPHKLRRDPENRLLSRGARYRLDAECLRDGALAMGGLLVEQLGGPSVKPYQPAGLWEAVGYTSSNTAKFVRDDGDKLYRRGLYTFWKRTSPPPAMALFDAPTREACTVRRSRTNTPLQALALLNDVQYVEAARGFAERALREGGESDDERLTWCFQSATSRRPDAEELKVLRTVLGGQREDFGRTPEGALELLGVGESPADPELDPVELAAWTTLTGMLLNLDETLTRG